MPGSRKKPIAAPRSAVARKISQPKPGDWLVYAPDRTMLLDVGRDLAKIRRRLEGAGTIFSNCYLVRQPFRTENAADLGGIEIEIR